MTTAEAIAQIREAAEALEASNAHGPWEWHHAYPQQVTNGAAVIIAECYEDPDSPSRLAEYIARVDPATVLALVAEVERLTKENERLEAEEIVLGTCPHGVDLDREFCPQGCRV